MKAISFWEMEFKNTNSNMKDQASAVVLCKPNELSKLKSKNPNAKIRIAAAIPPNEPRLKPNFASAIDNPTARAIPTAAITAFPPLPSNFFSKATRAMPMKSTRYIAKSNIAEYWEYICVMFRY